MKKPRRPNPKTMEEMQISEEMLERVEADPGFQRMMEESARAEREGRWTRHEEVVKWVHEARARRREQKRDHA